MDNVVVFIIFFNQNLIKNSLALPHSSDSLTLTTVNYISGDDLQKKMKEEKKKKNLNRALILLVVVTIKTTQRMENAKKTYN